MIPIPVDFRKNALAMIARGIPVIPLQRYYDEKDGKKAGKDPASVNGASDATLSPAQVEAWASLFPDMNVGAVAQPVNPDGQTGVWLLDDDLGDLMERYSEGILTIPKTLTVRSSGKKRHYYFRQTPASVQMGNQSYDKNPALGFSARVDNLYVVAPGSIHPDTLEPYEIVNDAAIIPAPDEFVEWLQFEIARVTGSKSAEAPRASDAKMEHQLEDLKRFLAYGNLDIQAEKFVNGRCLIELDPDQCPFGGHRPGEGLVCVSVSAEGKFGFRCMHCTSDHEWADPNDHTKDFHWGHFRSKVQGSRFPVIFGGFREFKSATNGDALVDRPTDEFEADTSIKPREPLLAIHNDGGPIITEKSITQVYARRGSGKTNFLIGLAKALSTGGEFLYFKAAKPLQVLYVEGEMPDADMQERFKNQTAGNKNLFLMTIGMQADSQIPSLFTEAGRKKIVERIEARQADVVILDSISSLFGFDTNKEVEWQDVCKWFMWLRNAVRGQGIALIFAHHAGKGQDRGARGHSKGEDLLDVSIELRPSDEDLSQGLKDVSMRYDKLRSYVPGAKALQITMAKKNFDGQKGIIVSNKVEWAWGDKRAFDRKKAFELFDKGVDVKSVATTLNIKNGAAQGFRNEYNEQLQSKKKVDAVGFPRNGKE